ncbi:hypothetical protein BH10PSE10_BH10PSE10_13570 [soil metagenome]
MVWRRFFSAVSNQEVYAEVILFTSTSFETRTRGALLRMRTEIDSIPVKQP